MARRTARSRRIPRIVFVFGGILTLITLLVFAAVVSFYDHTVRKRMDGRRWNLPTRIYSGVWAVRPGETWSQEEIRERLERLRYTQVPDVSKLLPGRFAEAGRRTAIWVNDRPSPQGRISGGRVFFEFAEKRISAIRRLDDGQSLPFAVFEPQIAGSVFDQKMEDRTLVTLDQISPFLKKAVIATEDRDFYSHGGISFRRILGAAFRNLTRGSVRQGGSTLTQQLVKNLFLTHERTFQRKAKEALLAVILEVRYSKDEIFESYLNEIYLGQRGAVSVTGVEEASHYYFGKPARDLDIPESAMLAGLIASPGRFSPFRAPEAARRRRGMVLKWMLETQAISKEQYDAATAAPLTTLAEPPLGIQAPHFVDFVLSQLEESREQLSVEGLSIFTTLDPEMQESAEAAVLEGLKTLEEKYSRLKPRAGQAPLQAALIALDPATGAIRALVGGRDYQKSQFNRVVQAKRQPGSLFKPFVFLAAFSNPEVRKRITPATVLQDTPITIEFGNGPDKDWTPKNYDGSFRGPVTVRQTLEKSINIPTIRIAMETESLRREIVEIAKACGITSPLKEYPSIALGSYEVTPMEIAGAYAAFANGGFRVTPTALTGVSGENVTSFHPVDKPFTRAAAPAPIAVTVNLLQGVVNRGTAASSRRLGAHGIFAGKTGTTNEGRDAWFIGFSPRLLVAVWVGFDDNRGLNLSGTMAALPIFSDFVRRRPAHEFELPFPDPPGIRRVPLDPASGLLATSSCPETITEVFLDGTQPTGFCPLHEGTVPPAAPAEVPGR